MPDSGSVPSTLTLEGAIIVLTYPRTGSSLLMQTLQLLGVEIVGEFSRADAPQEANPKGFFENLDLLQHGLHSTTLAGNPALLRGRAVKFALPSFARRQSPAEWSALAAPHVVRLLPIRSPAETLLSEKNLLKEKFTRGSADVVFSARTYLTCIGALTRWLSAPAFAAAAPACIDHRQAIDDPQGYVARVARCARLQPSAAQLAAAVANIDRDLYRVRNDARGPAQSPNSQVDLLEEIYRVLRSGAADAWPRLDSLLPAWTRDIPPPLAPGGGPTANDVPRA